MNRTVVTIGRSGVEDSKGSTGAIKLVARVAGGIKT
jgi:hypothetical protein